MSDKDNYAEMNKMIDELGHAITEFKEANDEALQKKADGEAFSEIEIKVERLNDEIGKREERIRKLDAEREADRARIESLEQMMLTGGTIGNKKVNEEHAEAFVTYMASGGRGNALDRLFKAERKYRAHLPEQKQINLASAAAGEALVPEIIVQAIETYEKKMSPVRRLIPFATVGSTDFKQVADIGGTGSGWLGETDTRSITANATLRVRTPTWGELYARPQATEWAQMDIPGAVEWITNQVAREFVSAEGIAVISGNGTNRPTGFLNTTPLATPDESSPLRNAEAVELIAAPSPDDITEHLLMLIYALQTGYRANAAFVLNSTTLGLVRRAKTSQGDYLWEPNLQSGEPPRIAGFPFEVWEDMPDAGASPADFPVAFGDWSRGYLAAQRTGVMLLVDPFTTIGLVSYWFRRREGGIILNNDAIKVAQR